MTGFLQFLLPPSAGEASYVLVDRVLGHEGLATLITCVCRYGNVAAHVILHVAELSKLFLAL